MEKEQPDSMATVAIKPDYPPSEYSSSEPPPAYRHRMSSSVQIARIVAFTIVISSFILGSFILASSWVSARAGCQQLEQLDAMLDKELALEGRAYGNDGLIGDEPLPVSNAHALHGAPPPSLQPPAAPSDNKDKPEAASHTADDSLHQAESKLNEDKLQKLDDDSVDKAPNKVDNDESSEESDSTASDEDEDDLDAIRPSVMRLPIQFDLDDLAGAFLANNNQKGRMNCVVERRHEEVVEKRFPFNILGAFGARPEPAERIAIICHGGDDRPVFPEPAAQVFAFPLTGPSRLPLRPMPPSALQPPAAPAQGPAHQHRPMPFPMPWDSSEEGSPREMRIHLQRVIAIPAPHHMPPPPEGNFPRQDNMIHFQDIPFNRPNLQDGPFNRPNPQDGPFNRPHPQDGPFNRPIALDGPFGRPIPQDMPYSRPAPQDNMIPFPRPQENVMNFPRPQENVMNFPRPQENVMNFPRPQENAMNFPRPLPQETMMPFPQQQQPQGDQNEQPTVMHQFIPQPPQNDQEIEQPEKIQMESMGMPVGLPWGLTPETLRFIHRHAVEAEHRDEPDSDQQIDNDMQEVKTIVNTLAAAAVAEVEGEAEHQSQETPATPQDAPAEDAAVHLDAPVLIQQEGPPEERPHYVQPRSVRSVDALLHREKRVKRCACDCA